MKISIIGNCGSGKSTLARNISDKLGIPYIELDRFWFEAGGLDVKNGETQKAEEIRQKIETQVKNFINDENWVSDGFYSRVQPLICAEADHLVFIDIPLYRRIFNHIKRVFFSKRHPELNMWHEFLFIFEIIKRTFTKGPKMRKFAEENSEKLIHIKSYKEMKNYFDSLK